MTERSPWNRRTKPLTEPHLARLQFRMDRGASLEEAAAEVGLTLSLAKSVYIRSGLPVPKPLRHKGPDPLGPLVHQHLTRVGSSSAADVAKALGVTAAEVRKAVWPLDRDRLVARTPPAAKHADVNVLLGLKLMALERGRQVYARGPVPVSSQWWDDHRDPAAHPPASVVKARFGSWTAACQAAGIPVRLADQVPVKRWTDEQLEAVLREFFAAKVGDTAGAYGVWAEGRDVPTAMTLMRRLGGWPALRAQYDR